MSRNNKNTRLIREARQMSAQRKGGSKGPTRTLAAHNKRKESCIWYQKKYNLLPKKRQKKQDVEVAPEVVE